ncbi:MAG: histidine kinase dimerization/phosphoacceptor domain -containing protein [Flavobacteriales bacterium]
MKKRAISEPWTIIGVSVLMVLALGLLARGLVRNKERAQQLGMLALDRAVDSQRWRFDLLAKTFDWDLDREANYVSAQDHRSDEELLERWLPLLQNRYPIKAIGLTNDHGDERTLQRVDSTWRFTSTFRSQSPLQSLSTSWPMRRPFPVIPPDTIAQQDDPRESIWFSQALEDRQDQPVWSVSETDGPAGASEETMHVSLLIRGQNDTAAYRVIHLDIDPSSMLGDLTRWSPEISTTLLSDKGRPLAPIDTSHIGSAWRTAMTAWQSERPTHEFHRSIGDESWVGRIVPYDLNGAVVHIGVMIDFDPIERWNEDGRQALWWVLGLLVLLALLLVLVMLQSRNSDMRVLRQQRRSTVQARNLAQALGEREVLDREVHHRVKNNLQVVSSLLNLQAQRIVGIEARAEFARGKRRIDSMALVHHKLYRQRDLSAIDLHVFLDDLTKAVSAMFEPESRAISHKVHTAGAHTNADTGIQLGMILCELLSNCYLHAFPHSTVGHIDIRVTPVDQEFFKLSVSDNGKGSDTDEGEHLGLEIVEALADQLDGTMQWRKDGGTTVDVTFRIHQTVLPEGT